MNRSILVFTISRYLGYGLKIIQSFLIAKFLGPYFFGVWGFLGLVQRYLLYTSFGLPNAVTVELSITGFACEKKQKQTIGVALAFTCFSFFFLSLAGLSIQIFDIALSDKYTISQFAALLGIIVGLDHINQLYVNIYRVYHRLVRIIIGEQLVNILPLVVLVFFREERLLFALLSSLLVSRLLAITLYSIKPPFSLSFSFDYKELKELLSIGIPLLIKNFSFFLITMAAQTIISIYYSVEEMGYYSLAYAVTNSTLLGINTVAWVIFPKILAKTNDKIPDKDVANTVETINALYGTSVFLFVYAMILGMPVLFMLLPEYQPTTPVLYILLLSQAIISASFGYNSVAVARKKQMKVAKISIVAVCFVALLAFIFAQMKLDFSWIAFSVFVGTFVYTFLQSRLGASLLNKGKVPAGYFQSMLPWGSLLSVLIALVFVFGEYTLLGGILGTVIFLFTNVKKLLYLYKFLKERLS